MTTLITPTMNPVEHALLLLAEMFQSSTTSDRFIEVCDELIVIGNGLTPQQKDELTVRSNEMVERQV